MDERSDWDDEIEGMWIEEMEREAEEAARDIEETELVMDEEALRWRESERVLVLQRWLDHLGAQRPIDKDAVRRAVVLHNDSKIMNLSPVDRAEFDEYEEMRHPAVEEFMKVKLGYTWAQAKEEAGR